MNEHEGETNGEAGKVTSTLLGIRGAEDNEHEDAGKDDFSQQAANHRDTLLQVVGTRAFNSGVGGEKVKQCGADKSADDLEDHVHASVLGGNALRQETA